MSSRNYDVVKAALAGLPVLDGKIEAYLIITAAPNILNEAPGTANHTNRVLWANAIVTDDAARLAEVRKFRIPMLQNATILAGLAANPPAVEDSDVEFVAGGFVTTAIVRYTTG